MRSRSFSGGIVACVLAASLGCSLAPVAPTFAVAETGGSIQQALSGNGADPAAAQGKAGGVSQAEHDQKAKDRAADKAAERGGARWSAKNGTGSYTLEKANGSTRVVPVEGVKRVGIDVSSYNGAIDWSKVADDGVSFAIIRCGTFNKKTGLHSIDKRFVQNIQGARAAGIQVGVYLYSYAKDVQGDAWSAQAEARNVLSFLEKAGVTAADVGLPIYYDLEDASQAQFPPEKLGAFAREFCGTLEAQGFQVGVYANKSWWAKRLTDETFDAPGWHRWAARYPAKSPIAQASVPGVGAESAQGIWQFSDRGTVNGIRGAVDMNFDFQGVDGADTVREGRGVAYAGHVQSKGWKPWVSDGASAGTEGRQLRLEAFAVRLVDQAHPGGIEYRAHVQGEGWQDWKSDGQVAGSLGDAKRIEALEMRLTGEAAQEYDLFYRLHVETIGWTGWARNGEPAGTQGFGARAEACQVVLVPKGAETPGSTAGSFVDRAVHGG